MRNTLLKQLADLAEELRHAVEGQEVLPVEGAESVLGFWRQVRSDALRKEQQPGAELQLLTITHGADAVFVRTERRGGGRSQVFAQRYQSDPLRPIGNWFLMGNEGPMFPAATPAAAPQAPSAALAALLNECVRATLEWVRIGDPTGSQLYSESGPLFSPVLYAPIDGKTVMSRFALGGHGWAMQAASKVLSEHPATTLAVLLYDDMTTRNGVHARSLRFRAQERGMPHALEYALAYDAPAKGKPFTTRGELRLLRTAQPLFR